MMTESWLTLKTNLDMRRKFMKELKFFKCQHCGNVVVKLVEKNVPVFCCGVKMEEIKANTLEASTEKHLPIVTVNNDIIEVNVGSIAHPMEEAHYINFIVAETDKGYSIVSLLPGMSPKVKIYIGEQKLKAVYEYCNLHGLWKSEIA